MKGLVFVAALLGLFQFDALAQDSRKTGSKNTSPVIWEDNIEVDTTIFLTDGGEVRFVSRSSTYGSLASLDSIGYNSWGAFSSKSPAVREFEEVQRQIMRQLNEDAVRVSAYYSRLEEESQERDRKLRAQLRNQKVVLFTDIIGLTPSEAQHFWPLYNEYSLKREDIMNKRREAIVKLRQAELNVSNSLAERVSREYLGTFEDEAALKLEYDKRYKGILSPAKILMIYKAEEEFKVLLLKSRF